MCGILCGNSALHYPATYHGGSLIQTQCTRNKYGFQVSGMSEETRCVERVHRMTFTLDDQCRTLWGSASVCCVFSPVLCHHPQNTLCS